jgi:hypothetical protein
MNQRGCGAADAEVIGRVQQHDEEADERQRQTEDALLQRDLWRRHCYSLASLRGFFRIEMQRAKCE